VSFTSALQEVTGGLEGVPVIGTAIHGYQDLGAAAAKSKHPAQSHTGGQLEKEAQIVRKAAEKYRINSVILWGVYGAETAHGSDVKTSSTGAVGPFQFEPATAKAYGYPTNKNVNGVTDLAAFQRQAEAAAHYLSSLLPPPGTKHRESSANWEKALHVYSGGGYGYAHIVKEGSAFSKIFGGQAEKEKITAHTEELPSEGEGVWGKLAKLALNFVLLLAGAVLVVYGIMVAVRPRDRALSIPSIPFVA
jgi:hypothetical protein